MHTDRFKNRGPLFGHVDSESVTCDVIYVMATLTQSTDPPPTASPALAVALPYVKSGASILLSLLATAPRAAYAAVAFVTTVALRPLALVILAPLPALLYILSPAIVALQIFLSVLVYTPWRVAAFLTDAFYPAYVFLGVACITGALLGLSGRLAVLCTLALVPSSPPRNQLAAVKRRKG